MILSSFHRLAIFKQGAKYSFGGKGTSILGLAYISSPQDTYCSLHLKTRHIWRKVTSTWGVCFLSIPIGEKDNTIFLVGIYLSSPKDKYWRLVLKTWQTWGLVTSTWGICFLSIPIGEKDNIIFWFVYLSPAQKINIEDSFWKLDKLEDW